MKVIILTFLVGYSFASWANTDLLEVKDIIKDPAISRRCKNLLNERQDKIKIQQRLTSLIMRNDKLSRATKPKQKTVRQKLLINKTQLENHLRLAKLKVSSMEEDIVRKGCPGIRL